MIDAKMRVQNLELKNFRGIRTLSLDFGENIVVLVGVNGSGKTSIIEALRVIFGQLIFQIQGMLAGKIPSSKHPIDETDYDLIKFLHEKDVQIGMRDVSVIAKVSISKHTITWGVNGQLQIPGEINISKEFTKQLEAFTENLSTQTRKEPLTAVPLAIYYAFGHNAKEILPSRSEVTNQLRAFDHALDGTKPSSDAFITWFRRIEDYENEKRTEDSSFRDAQLQAVRHVVEKLLPGFSSLRIRRQPVRMVMHKGSVELEFKHLSEGERYLLTLGADIVRRLSLANPKEENPRLCGAVVLIDEIDTHLHPSWQRRIIPALRNAFPNCQFIIATHSPQVLSNVPPECIYMLSQENGELSVTHPEASFGRDSNRILEDLMGVDERPSEIKKKLSDYFLLIDQGKMEEAQSLRQELESSIGSSDPEFTRADVLVQTRELLSR